MEDVRPAHRAVNDGFHIGNSADSLAILGQQTVLYSTLASQATARKTTATSTANLTDSQSTPTTTAGASKIRTPTLVVVSTKTVVDSTRSLMTYKKPTMDAFS